MGLIPGWGRSPGGGRGSPLQCSCLDNPMDRGAWQAAVRGVAKSWTQLKRLSTYRSEVLFERGIVRDIRASEIWLVLKILRGKANQFLIHFWFGSLLFFLFFLPPSFPPSLHSFPFFFLLCKIWQKLIQWVSTPAPPTAFLTKHRFLHTEYWSREFPGSPVVRTQLSLQGAQVLSLGLEKSLHAAQPEVHNSQQRYIYLLNVS